jgi:mRNA-degrading endonuclease RelE of RelBE toxin-antitoxin system
MYQLEVLRPVRKDLKRLSKDIAHRIVHFYFPKIAKSPQTGTPLSGNLKGIGSMFLDFKEPAIVLFIESLRKKN